MALLRHTISRTLDRWISGIRRRRLRRQGERVMNELPLRMQKDVGWEPAAKSRHR